MNAHHFIADFDSSSAMLRAAASTMHGRDLPMMGTHSALMERALQPVSRLLDRLPQKAREQIYIRSGALEAVRQSTLRAVDAEGIARWSASLYPDRRSPIVAIGSSNGALTHLWAALGAPWLPQTVLIPVRRDARDVDDVEADFAWGKRAAPRLLERNPELVLHQMIDPVQDRLMVHRMAYFRVKRIVLGATYEQFLKERLAPGGTIVIVDCTLDWGTTTAGERHVFQHGAVGGPTEDEYRDGGPRVARYLREQRSSHSRWHPPRVDQRTPEAEWGYDDRLTEDVVRIARQHGWRVVRLRFADPEDASPLVADIFANWNEQRGIRARRLLVSSFILMDPTLMLRAGAIPFWITFNTESSARSLEQYVAAQPTFDAIDMTLFSHGVDSIGLVPLERWAALRARARSGGELLGVDARAFPKDFGNFIRYHADLVARLGPLGPLPQPLDSRAIDRLLSANIPTSRVAVVEET